MYYFTSISPRSVLPLYTANFMFQKVCLYFFLNNHRQHTHKNKPILQSPTRKTQIRKKGQNKANLDIFLGLYLSEIKIDQYLLLVGCFTYKFTL